MAKQFANRRIQKKSVDSDRRQLSVFDVAEEGKDDVLRQMLEDNQGLVYKTHEYGLASALHYAARAGHIECVEWLLDFKAPVNHRDQSSATALHFAAEFGHADIVKRLLDAGADKTLTNYYRQGSAEFRDTPRDVAVYFQHPNVVEILDTYVPTAMTPGSKHKEWREAEDARIAALEAELERREAEEAARRGGPSGGTPKKPPSAGRR